MMVVVVVVVVAAAVVVAVTLVAAAATALAKALWLISLQFYTVSSPVVPAIIIGLQCERIWEYFLKLTKEHL